MAAIKAYFDPAACSAPATSYNENRKEALLLKIAVCIKQVPATQDAKMDPDKGVLLRDSAAARLNPYDVFAIEAALRLKEGTAAPSPP